MKKIIIRIMKFAKKYYMMILLSVVLSLLLSLANAAPALLIKYGIDSLIEKKTDVLIYTITAIMLLGFAKGLISYFSEITRENIANKIIFDIRKTIYGHLQMMSLSFYHKNETGQLMSRFTNDAVKVQGMITNFFSLFSSFGTIIILLSYVVKINWKLALGSLLIIPFIGYVIKKFSKRVSTTGKDVQEKIGSLNSFLEEIFLGIRVIKAFGTENYEIRRFEGENKKNFDATMKNVKVKARVSPIIEIFNSFAISGLFLMGGYAVINGKMTAGDLMSFITSIALLYTPLRNITGINNEMQTARHSAERIFEILDEELEINDDKDAVTLDNINGEVKFENVNFRYTKDGNQVIKNVNLSAKSGQSIALVGRSGSGKTTLVSLLSRFYDINEGTIEIDGVKINKIKLESLRKHVGIVPQESFIFRGTIFDNICYGTENISEELVIEAAKKANVMEFAEKMPNGIYSNVGERGGKLSGGQKQRIAIARALIKDPKILILDEATSALDTESERLVQEAIERLMKGRTTFVIAHRLSTIINADKIVVMDVGEVKEEGTHKELLEQDGIYKQLYNMQFGKENEDK